MTATATSLEAVVAAWDEDDLRCQTQQCPCTRPAKWITAHHTPACGETQMVCNRHYRRWLRLAWEIVAYHGSVRCTVCQMEFRTPEECVRFRPV
jgi:predicted HNH restriction endonuclease